MKQLRYIAFAFLLVFGFSSAQIQEDDSPDAKIKVQVALLLDTSGSMDGLLEQAKSQLWKIVNELALSKYKGKSPDLEIALYEFGKSSYPSEEGFIKQLSPFSTDLDHISELLFALNTNGGEEYCGEAILHATEQLDWSSSKKDLKLLFIAGNESFDQKSAAKFSYTKSCPEAQKKGIIVNTIFCGDCKEGIRLEWEKGAKLGGGDYLCINHNAVVQHIETPFDEQIQGLNQQLNQTYVSYGHEGAKRMKRQEAQDMNAAQMSKASGVERAISKSSSSYNNSSWDMVDAFEEDEAVLQKEEALPEEMKKMSKEERKTFVEAKAKERKELQEQIQELNKKRQAFITEARKEQAGSTENTLDAAMLSVVRKQATNKGLKKD